jgi:prepilin peptidase CpaA
VLTALFGGVLIGAAASDVMTLRIPNLLSLALVALFAVHVVTSQMPLMDILWHLTAGTIVLGGGMALFAWGKFGGGDAKLIAAVALWVGASLLMPLLILVSLVGLVIAVVILALRSRGLAINKLPYGVAIAGGWLLLFFIHS